MRRRVMQGLLALGLAGGLAASAIAGGDVEIIRAGDVRIDLDDHVVDGKLVLFEFYADWCAACKRLEPTLQRIASQYPDDLALRKVDIEDWSSPTAERYGITAIPHLVLYDRTGGRVDHGPPRRVLASLRERLAEADVQPAGGGEIPPLIGAMLVLGTALLAAAGYGWWTRRGLAPAGAERPFG